MNGPSARALREGGTGGSQSYKCGVTLIVKLSTGGPLPPEWRRKTTLQEPFGDYGHILRIDVQEAQGVAFIEYEDARDAEDAAEEMNGRQIKGRNVSVQVVKAYNSGKQAVGTSTMRVSAGEIEERVGELARKHRLDEAAAGRLSSVFQDRSRVGCDLTKDFEELDQHLGASNKPSALVSMKLADLRSGKDIGPCKFNASAARKADAVPQGRRHEGREARELREFLLETEPLQAGGGGLGSAQEERSSRGGATAGNRERRDRRDSSGSRPRRRSRSRRRLAA